MKLSLIGLTVCLMLVLSGCFGGMSAPSTFYKLQNENDISVVSTQKISIGILPIQVPDYLDKPQIVLNGGKNQMTVSETNRWIEPLSAVTQAVLVNDMQQMLPNAFVKTKGYDDGFYNRIVRVEVEKMEGTLGHEATLSAWWFVLNNDGKELYRGRFSNTEQINHSYESYTQGQSILWAKLSQQIAEYITAHK